MINNINGCDLQYDSGIENMQHFTISSEWCDLQKGAVDDEQEVLVQEEKPLSIYGKGYKVFHKCLQ